MYLIFSGNTSKAWAISEKYKDKYYNFYKYKFLHVSIYYEF